MDNPFHQQELAVQRQTGVSKEYQQRVGRFIRDAMPEQHQTFYASLPFVILSAVDNTGHPWVMPVFNPEGMLTIHSEYEMSLNALPLYATELGLQLAPGDKVGLLGIELATRRRNRVNAYIVSVESDSIRLHVDQSFGNCPKYIQTRDLQWVGERVASTPVIHTGLATDVREFIARADTFYIGSRSALLSDDPRNGLDASHRGGKPGFIKIEGDSLTFPDFSGNNFFNTIGNIQSDSRVGLFFANWQTGEMLLLSGNAMIDWAPERKAEFEGAERFVVVDIERTAIIPNGLPYAAPLIEESPALVGTGNWQPKEAKRLPEMAFYTLFKSGFEAGSQS